MNKIVATLITLRLLFLFFVSVSSHSLDHGSKDINNLSGVISTSHPMATMAGEAILIKGGNSVDAAIAAERDVISGVDEDIIKANFVRMLIG